MTTEQDISDTRRQEIGAISQNESSTETVMGLELELSVRLSGLKLTVEKILSLSVGQSIVYRFDPDAVVLLEVDSEPIAQASFVKSKGVTTLKIDRLLGDSSDLSASKTD